MVKTSLTLVAILFVTGCAAKPEKWQGYIGEDIQKIVADYGNPNVAFDMGDGRRDFQWLTSSSTQPSYSISPGALTKSTNQFSADIKPEILTPMHDNKALASECLLTIVTHWNEDKKTWIVTGYQQPTSGCQAALNINSN